MDADTVENVDRDKLVEGLAVAWRTATASISFVPLSSPIIKERFLRLAEVVLDMVGSDHELETVISQGRAIGRELVGLNLHKPEVLEQTLLTLTRQLDGLATPERLVGLTTGIATGFTAAMEANLLRQQEGVSQAATLALFKAQRELQISRDGLAAANEELSAQIAERTRAEEKQRDLAERLQHLHRIETAILSAESLSAIVDISINFIEHFIPSLCVAIFLIDVNDHRAITLASNHLIYPPGREIPITLLDALKKLGAGDVTYVNDYASLPNPSPAILELVAVGGRSSMNIPLRYRDELIGGLTIILGEARSFTETEETIAREFAGSMALAIQNRRLLEAEKIALERETTLREVAAALTLDLGLDEMLQHVLAQLERVIASDSSSIMLSNRRGLEIVCQRGVENKYDDLSNLLKARPRSVWSVLETSQPRIINDTRSSPDWILAPGREYIRSWMGVPLLVKGECMGIMTIDRREPNAFSSQDMELAATFANQAAVAIENARLFARQQAHTEEMEKRVRERTRDLEVLYGITATAVGNPDMEEFLQRAMSLMAGAFGCVAAATFLDESDASDLHLAALLESGEHELSKLLAELEPNDPLLRRPFTSGMPEVLSDRDLPRRWSAPDGLTMAVMPLRSRGRSLGLMGLVCHEDARLTTVSSDLWTTIADQIGAVVENIRLHQIARQSAIIEERERLARDIHDQVTQSIYSASLFAEAARGAAESGNMEKLQQHHQSILRMTNQALRELRLLLFEFRTEALARKGLIDALRERLNTVEHRAGISGEVYAPGIGNLPVAIEETYYRIALEALNNSLRHARGDRVDIILLEESGDLIMTIVDNGIGFDREVAAASGGMGLEGMQKRIGKVEGELTLSSSPGGTWVTARASLKQ